MVRANIQPGKIDEGIGIFRNSVAPAARQQQGFKNVYLLVDRAGNKIIGLSLWESEADLSKVFASGFYQEQVGKFAAVFAGPPEREVYEVALEV